MIRDTIKKIVDIFSSRIATLALLAIYAVVLALATFVEKRYSTQIAKEVIYNSWWFIAFHLLMIANFVGVLVKGRYIARRCWGVVITHFAFITILIGALTTHLTGEEGILHVREGDRSSTMVVQTPQMQKIVNLPFSVELRDFVLKRYPGSSSPSSYESYITLHVDGQSREELIYMNRTLDIKGYRLFQASFDQDEKGTVLIVNQDAVGRTISYVGYALLLLGLVVALFIRNGRVVTLFSKLSKLNVAPLLLLGALLYTSAAQGQNFDGEDFKYIKQYSVPVEHAERFGELPMQNPSGRLMPVNTFASEILRKLHKESSIGGLTPEQFLLSLWLMPDVWSTIPFIEYDEAYLDKKYGLRAGGYFAFMDIFDSEGGYRFQGDLEQIYAKSASERSKSDSELLKIDEKINILDQLFKYEMIRLFPDEAHPNHLWYAPGDDLSELDEGAALFANRVFLWYLSEIGKTFSAEGSWSEVNRVLDMIPVYQKAKGQGAGLNYDKIEAELKYNRSNIFARSKVLYLILGGLLLLFSLLEMINPQKWMKYLKFILWVGTLCVFHHHMYGMYLRWQIGGFGPWSNSYETMVYIAWISAIVGLLFAKRITFVFAVATLFAGVVLFVSGLNWMDPQITPLVPVLRSRWLMVHVSVIVAAYGLLGICLLLGLTNMILMIVRGKKEHTALDHGISELTIINEIAMWFGLTLLTVGTFLGAVWANESWGRYWGWDPKETWALITMIIYAAVTHLHMAGRLYSKYTFNLLSMIAFLSVLMTYFGVNYFLSGLHSYNSSKLSMEVITYVALGVGILLAVGAVAGLRYKEKQH